VVVKVNRLRILDKKHIVWYNGVMWPLLEVILYFKDFGRGTSMGEVLHFVKQSNEWGKAKAACESPIGVRRARKTAIF
jgi:hypothetical protein